MAEELRLFIRVALYTSLAGGIYWFVSYEIAGSVLLGFLVIATCTFAGAMATLVGAARSGAASEGGRARRAVVAAGRVLTFEDPVGASNHEPLEIEEEPFPTLSIWPLVLSVGALLVGLGLVFGAWFWTPGGVLIAAAAWGWVTELSD